MGRLHDLADARNVACYLECVGAKNQAIYEKIGLHKGRGGNPNGSNRRDEVFGWQVCDS
jgi:hypothetical protein